jgi:hypothetical protein
MAEKVFEFLEGHDLEQQKRAQPRHGCPLGVVVLNRLLIVTDSRDMAQCTTDSRHGTRRGHCLVAVLLNVVYVAQRCLCCCSTLSQNPAPFPNNVQRRLSWLHNVREGSAPWSKGPLGHILPIHTPRSEFISSNLPRSPNRTA